MGYKTQAEKNREILERGQTTGPKTRTENRMSSIKAKMEADKKRKLKDSQNKNAKTGSYFNAAADILGSTRSSGGGDDEGLYNPGGSTQTALQTTGTLMATGMDPVTAAVVGGTIGVIKARANRKTTMAKIEAKKQEELGRIEGEKGDRIQKAMAGLGQAFSKNLNRRLQVRL